MVVELGDGFERTVALGLKLEFACRGFGFCGLSGGVDLGIIGVLIMSELGDLVFSGEFWFE